MALKFFIPIFLVLHSCNKINLFKYYLNKNNGVPLNVFSTKDHDYFPDAIDNFFPGAIRFGQDFPNISEARSGIRLIEIKRLTKIDKSWNESNLSWSADGIYLGYEIVTGKERKILVKNVTGDYSRTLKIVANKKDTFLNGMVINSLKSYNSLLRWAEDSTRYTFMSNGGIGEYNIYVGSVGGDDQIIAKSPTKDGYANWNPVKNQIVFVSARSGNGDLYIVNIDTRKLYRLTESDNIDIFPDWFPNGNRIVYSSGSSRNHNLKIIELNNSMTWTKPTYLTKWSQDDLRPTVSPNGKYIAFYSESYLPDSTNKKTWNLHAIKFLENKLYKSKDLRKTIVATDVVIDLNTGPAWSPDSRKLFYVKRDQKNFNPIYGYDLFTGRRYMLKTNTKLNRDLMISNLGLLSFRSQVGAWDRVFIALTNQGMQLQSYGNNGNIQTLPHYINFNKLN